MNNKTQIKCPNCGTSIDVQDILSHQLEEEIKEMNGVKVILPIWHKVTKDEVLSYSPTLADKLAFDTSLMSIDEIADELKQFINDSI